MKTLEEFQAYYASLSDPDAMEAGRRAFEVEMRSTHDLIREKYDLGQVDTTLAPSADVGGAFELSKADPDMSNVTSLVEHRSRQGKTALTRVEVTAEVDYNSLQLLISKDGSDQETLLRKALAIGLAAMVSQFIVQQ